MRYIRQLFNNIREAFQGVARNKAMGLLSVVSITSVLVLFGVVLLLILNMTGLVAEAGQKVDSVVVYLQDTATDQEIQAIITEAETTGLVKDIEFTSKEQALEKFQEQLDLNGNEYLIEGLEENPLPSSLTLKLSNIEEAGKVAKVVGGMPGVERASYLNELIGKVVQMTEWVKILGFIVVTILLFIAIVLIHNTIKATMANRKQEIHIMKYVGASDGYIRRPLLLEGLFFGVIASFIALVIVYYGYGFVVTAMEEKLKVLFGMNLVPARAILLDISVIFGCIGIGVGLLGSSLSVKRFLNV